MCTTVCISDRHTRCFRELVHVQLQHEPGLLDSSATGLVSGIVSVTDKGPPAERASNKPASIHLAGGLSKSTLQQLH